MPLFLNNDDQRSCITPTEAVEAIENGLRRLALGDGIRRPRIDNAFHAAAPDLFWSRIPGRKDRGNPGQISVNTEPAVKFGRFR